MVDLHLHSTASDGVVAPADVVAAAAGVGLSVIGLTDHDTLDGVEEAQRAAGDLGIRVIPGCEFSVSAPWGEVHLLGYYLPLHHRDLHHFFHERRTLRESRARALLDRLGALGIHLSWDDVARVAAGAVVGRPHIARAMMHAGAVSSIQEAFDRYLRDGGPAYVSRPLPPVEEVTRLVRRVGGVTSAAHLRGAATAEHVRMLRDAGVDAVEVTHPGHNGSVRTRLGGLAKRFGLLRTGGSDWHGQGESSALGRFTIPNEWEERLARLHEDRVNGAGHVETG